MDVNQLPSDHLDASDREGLNYDSEDEVDEFENYKLFEHDEFQQNIKLVEHLSEVNKRINFAGSLLVNNREPRYAVLRSESNESPDLGQHTDNITITETHQDERASRSKTDRYEIDDCLIMATRLVKTEAGALMQVDRSQSYEPVECQRAEATRRCNKADNNEIDEQILSLNIDINSDSNGKLKEDNFDHQDKDSEEYFTVREYTNSIMTNSNRSS